jgi:hypothetical protein
MIVFLLWAIVLILFWPVAAIIGVAWLFRCSCASASGASCSRSKWSPTPQSAPA